MEYKEVRTTAKSQETTSCCPSDLMSKVGWHWLQ